MNMDNVIKKIGLSDSQINKLKSTKGFKNIATALKEKENVKIIALICDDPRPQKKTKLSFARNWFVIVTDRRVLFISPTLVIGDIEQMSYPYKSIVAVSAGKWGSVNLNIIGSPFPVHFVLSSNFTGFQNEIVRIVEDAIL